MIAYGTRKEHFFTSETAKKSIDDINADSFVSVWMHLSHWKNKTKPQTVVFIKAVIHVKCNRLCQSHSQSVRHNAPTLSWPVVCSLVECYPSWNAAGGKTGVNIGALKSLCVNFKDISFLLRNILSDFWNRGKFFLFCSANVKTLHDFMKIMCLLLSLLEIFVTGKFYTCMMTHLNWNRTN